MFLLPYALSKIEMQILLVLLALISWNRQYRTTASMPRVSYIAIAVTLEPIPYEQKIENL